MTVHYPPTAEFDGSFSDPEVGPTSWTDTAEKARRASHLAKSGERPS